MVNSVINALVEQGDLDPNAEVKSVIVLLLCCYLSPESTSVSDKFYISLEESQGCGRYGWQAGMLVSEC